MVLDGSIDRSVVEDTIPDEPLDPVCDLGQQRRDVGWILHMALRYCGGDDPTLGIHPDMQCLPALMRPLPGLLAVPCALPTDLSPTTKWFIINPYKIS